MDYNAIAERYSHNRTASGCVIETLLKQTRLLGSGSRVLEIGCGTASHLLRFVEVSGCLGWGVEPSREMRRHAPGDKRVQLVEGTAERLPFQDDFFDLAFSVNVIHHVAEHTSYFAEAFRVLHSRGDICTFTDEMEMIKRRKPLSEYWPASAEADLKRYPTVESLLGQMAVAGFVEIRRNEIQSPFRVTDSNAYREKTFSCLHLIPEDEFKKGLERLEDDLRKGPVAGMMEYVCLWGKVP